MKRFFFITTFIVCCNLMTWSQSETGTFSIIPKIGLNISKITGGAPVITQLTSSDPIYYSDSYIYEANQPWSNSIISFANTENTSRYGFTGGVEVDYQLSKHWALAAEILYSVQGAKHGDVDIPSIEVKGKDVVVDMRSINIPITAKYYIYRGLAVRAGVQFGLLHNRIKGEFIRSSVSMHNWRDHADFLRSFDLAIPIGISYDFGDIVADARFNMGVTSVYNDKWDRLYPESTPSERNSVISLTLGYKFTLGK